MASIQQDPASQLPTPAYFSNLAASYSRQTANTTAILFANALREIQSSRTPISSSSTVHDIAAGPGTATSVLLAQDPPIRPRRVLISDNNVPMVAAARESFSKIDDVEIECKELSASELSSLPDAAFSHCIINFSIFVIPDPVAAVREMYRTLIPDGGLAVITTWKRFGLNVVIRRAQALLRPDLPPMPMPGPRFCEEGYLPSVVASGGFDENHIEVSELTLVAEKGERLDRLREFCLGDFSLRAKQGLSEDEVSRWPDAVERAITEEVEQWGGIKFEAWAVLASK
ncbi:uncharacterized protein DNG_02569 [Cephalotrichum gorgonifer]|uniref:Methyltransferase type 11 domain-containing protein n=1 Tax=Cephalotrichum gorgonifer TaxID=2041049 RepID=A0AAE8MSN8_9PEZI|nr:uncharacterized protein DNG_02569 [Cephalotrichum gorgonifer]